MAFLLFVSLCHIINAWKTYLKQHSRVPGTKTLAESLYRDSRKPQTLNPHWTFPKIWSIQTDDFDSDPCVIIRSMFDFGVYGFFILFLWVIDNTTIITFAIYWMYLIASQSLLTIIRPSFFFFEITKLCTSIHLRVWLQYRVHQKKNICLFLEES